MAGPYLVTGASGFAGRHLLESRAPGTTAIALVRDRAAWDAEEWTGRLERPLLAKMTRRLQTMANRPVRVDHPENDLVMNDLLREANLSPRRTLTHMRLDLL